MDYKDRDLGHPEVYEGRYSANGFYQFTIGTYWLVTEPIYVQNGRSVRAEAMYMHVFNNANGGARAGLVDGDGPFTGDFARSPSDRAAIENAINWGGWQGTYGAGKLPNRQWAKLSTPQIVPTAGHVRLALQFNVDNPGFGAAHWDVLRVEQYVEGTEPEPEPDPPVEGVLRVEIIGPVDVRIVE